MRAAKRKKIHMAMRLRLDSDKYKAEIDKFRDMEHESFKRIEAQAVISIRAIVLEFARKTAKHYNAGLRFYCDYYSNFVSVTIPELNIDKEFPDEILTDEFDRGDRRRVEAIKNCLKEFTEFISGIVGNFPFDVEVNSQGEVIEG